MVRVTNIEGSTEHELVGEIGENTGPIDNESGEVLYGIDLSCGLMPLYYSEFEVWA